MATSAVIYWSDEDDAWVAHSLAHDQVGIAASPVDALAELLQGLRALHELADEDPSVVLRGEPPAEVVAMAHHARPFPRELYEVAHRKALGDWPEDWQVDARPTGATRMSFRTELEASPGS